MGRPLMHSDGMSCVFVFIYKVYLKKSYHFCVFVCVCCTHVSHAYLSVSDLYIKCECPLSICVLDVLQ